MSDRVECPRCGHVFDSHQGKIACIYAELMCPRCKLLINNEIGEAGDFWWEYLRHCFFCDDCENLQAESCDAVCFLCGNDDLAREAQLARIRENGKLSHAQMLRMDARTRKRAMIATAEPTK